MPRSTRKKISTLKRPFFTRRPSKITWVRVLALLRTYRVEVLLLAAAAICFIASLPYIFSNDEAAYLLNGKQILQGMLPYRDYFFHHMPGMDLLSAFIYIFSGSNLFIFRLLFNALLFGALVLNSILIYRSFGKFSARLYIIFMALFHMVWLHVAIGTSVIAYLLPLAFLLIWTSGKVISIKRLVVISLILFWIPFINLGYILVALVLYLLLAYRLLVPLQKTWLPNLVRVGAILAAPYIIFILVLILLGVLREFTFSNWEFNQRYYAPLIQDRVHGSLGLLPRLLNGTLSQIGSLFVNFSPAYLLQLLLLLSFPVTAFMLWRTNHKAYALGLVAILLAINPRHNLYAPPGITSSLAETVNYGSVYKSFALFLAALSIPWLLAQRNNIKGSLERGLGRLYAYAFLALVPLLLLQYTTHTFVKIALDKQDVNFVAHALRTSPDKAQQIDSVLEPEDTYWIGPVDFDTQLYAQSVRATRYSFYLPWIDACITCRTKLVNELRDTRPNIIIWKPFSLDGKPYVYSQEFRQLLEKEYMPLKEKGWEDYYIRNDWKDQFTSRSGINLPQ
jgi:hypothetical protein